MRKIILVIFCILIFTNAFCENLMDLAPSEEIKNNLKTQYNALSQNEKILLKCVKVILEKPENPTIPTKEINGVILSTVCISTELVSDPILNYKISHYIRNQFVLQKDRYIFQGYDEFVKSNSAIICEVLYYLYHKSFYGIYKIYSMESDNLFYDKRLGTDITNLQERLKKEKSLFMYGY